jgi:hypothetical protein
VGVKEKKSMKQLAASGRNFVGPFVKIKKYPQFQLFNCSIAVAWRKENENLLFAINLHIVMIID